MMRKKTTLVLILFLALILILPTLIERVGETAEPKLTQSIVFQIGTKAYFVNNQTPGIEMDVAPIIRDDRTLVPVRFLANALGITDDNIGWDDPLVTLSGPGFPVIKLTIGQKTIEVDGEISVIDVAPLIKDGRTMLPARFVAEALGYQVTWKAEQRLVVVWPKDTSEPDIGQVLACLLGTQVPEPAPGQPVTFSDIRLELIIREAVNKPVGEITRSDLLGLTSLSARRKEIRDLSGLEYAVNLTELKLGGNRIIDITSLTGLAGLTVLDLGGNWITDITPITGLTNLTVLDLGVNQVADIIPLTGLTSLTELDLDWIQITDITPLTNLTSLTGLNLGGNQITDITALDELTNLNWLNLASNQLTDITPLGELTNLSSLGLESNQIVDITPLAGLTNLTGLWLGTLEDGGNQVTDIAPLAGLTNLEWLNLPLNQVSDITPLAGLTNLNGLNLGVNQVTDITPLLELANLTRLDITENPLSEVAKEDLEILRARGVTILD